MATSSYPFFANQTPRTQVIAHASLRVAQVAALVTPPLVILTSIFRRNPLKPFTIKRLLNSTVRSTAVGAGLGAFMGWGRLRNEPETAILDRAERLRYNAGQVRTDDYSFIGASLSAVVVPALLLRRAPFPTLVAGGAAVGLGLGTALHIGESVMQGEEVKPTGMVGEIPVVGGNDK